MKKYLLLVLFFVMFMPSMVNAEPMKATDYIKKIAADNGGNPNSVEVIGETGLAYDGTADNNLRYVGSNPNNYVRFNNELWRIIGVMNNVENEDNSKQTKIKIIRKEHLGRYQWDYGYNWMSGNPPASNNWEESAIMKLFNPGYDNLENNNSLYWNAQKGNCFYYRGSSVQCDFTNTGLKDQKSKSMISKSKYYLGGSSTNNAGSQSTSMFYNIERSANVNAGYSSFWYGNIGLLYASDYGYATSGDETTTRSSCISNGLGFSNWQDTACSRNDWLTNSSNNEWTMTTTTNNVYSAHSIIKNGGISGIYYYSTSNSSDYIRPSLYIDPNASIVSGNGTQNDPYVLKIVENYNISFVNDEDKGTIEAENTNDIQETFVVSFNINPKKGYEVLEVEIKTTDGVDVEYTKNGNSYSFTMPDSDVSITPYYTKVKNSINVEIVDETKDLDIAINDLTKVEYGEEVTFTVTPIKGYKVKSIRIIDEEDNEIDFETTSNENEYKFVMPATSVTIIPNYERTKSSIEVEDDSHTKVLVFEVDDVTAVVYEDIVKFTIIPEEGYEIDKIEIVDAEGNYIEYTKTNNDNEYEFVMTSTDVKITPIYKKIVANVAQDTLKNPNTGDKLLSVILIMISCLVIGIFIYKKKESRYII